MSSAALPDARTPGPGLRQAGVQNGGAGLPTKMALWSGHLCQSVRRKDPWLGKKVDDLLG